MNQQAYRVEVGERFSRTRCLTSAEAQAFSLAAGDDNPLHHDADVAAQSRYGRLIASGTLTTALLLGLTASYFSKRSTVVGVSFSVTFRRAVYSDEEVTFGWEVRAVEPSPGGGQLVDLVGSLCDSAGRECVAAAGRVLVGRDAPEQQPGAPDGVA